MKAKCVRAGHYIVIATSSSPLQSIVDRLVQEANAPDPKEGYIKYQSRMSCLQR